MNTCANPLLFETLVAYWAGDLSGARTDEVDEHLIGCAFCTHASNRIAAITEQIRHFIPPIVTRAMVDSLRARGLRVDDNIVAPDTRNHVTFTTQDIIIHHLSGLELGSAERVSVCARVEETGEILLDQDAALFDANEGEVLIACQRHFAAFPPNIVFLVTTHDKKGRERTDRYFIGHEFVR